MHGGAIIKYIYNGPSQESESVLTSRLLQAYHHIAIDTETISLIDKTCIGIGIAINEQDTYYIPVLPEPSEILPQVYVLLTNPSITKVGHNINFDIDVLRQFALDNSLPEPDIWNIHDTNLMANVSALPPALHDLGHRLLGDYSLFTIQELLAETRQSIGRSKVTMLDVPIDKVARKCCNDVRTTYKLFEVLNKQLTTKTRDCYQVDIELTSYLKQMELKGLKIDHDKLEQRYNDLILKAEFYEDWGEEELGINIGSNQQVGMYLARDRVVLPLTKGGHQLDTSEEILSKVKHPVAKEVLDYRGIRKSLSTYIEPFLNADRSYTHFRLDLATGRLASSGTHCTLPHVCTNLQNIPSELRDIYTPDNNIWTWADASQLEMRVFAYLTQDPVLLEAYKTNKSVHEITFRSIYPQLPFDKNLHEYVLAKTFNFAMIFDATDTTLAEQCKIERKLAHDWKQTWKATYPVATQWMIDKVNLHEPIVETIFGRQMLLPNEFERGEAHVNKCRLNYPVQGSGADLNKRAMLKLLKGYAPPDIRLQVHDELLVDGDYIFPDNINEMYKGLYVPFEIKKGKIWL